MAVRAGGGGVDRVVAAGVALGTDGGGGAAATFFFAQAAVSNVRAAIVIKVRFRAFMLYPFLILATVPRTLNRVGTVLISESSCKKRDTARSVRTNMHVPHLHGQT